MVTRRIYFDIVLLIISWTYILVSYLPLANAQVNQNCNEQLISTPEIDLKNEQYFLESLKSQILKKESMQNQINPRSKALDNRNEMGLVEKRFSIALPSYSKLSLTTSQLLQLNNSYISTEQYLSFRTELIDQFNKAQSQRHINPDLGFALVISFSYLQSLHSLIEPEEILKSETNLKDTNDEEMDNSLSKSNASNREKEDDDDMADERTDHALVSNKDLKSDPNKKKPNYAIGTTATSQDPYGFLRLDIFENFFTGVLTKNYSLRAPFTNPTKNGEHQSFMRPKKGLTKIGIYSPYGHLPVEGLFNDFRIIRLSEGEYEAQSLKPNGFQDKITFNLTLSPAMVTLDSYQLEQLSKPSGILPTKWPKFLTDHMNAISLAHGSKEDKIKALQYYFTKGPDFKYSKTSEVGEQNFSRAQSAIKSQIGSSHFALALAEQKIFNCDGASVLFATLVRDFWALPSRIAVGRPITKSQVLSDGNLYYLADLNQPRHAWVEIYLNGNWIPFEVTPEIRKKEMGTSTLDSLSQNKNNDEQANSNDTKSMSDESQENESESTSKNNQEDESDFQQDSKSDSDSKNKSENELNEAESENTKTSFSRENLNESKDSIIKEMIITLAAKTLRDYQSTIPQSKLIEIWKNLNLPIHWSSSVKTFTENKIRTYTSSLYQEKNQSLSDLFDQIKTIALSNATLAYKKIQLIKKFYNTLSEFAQLTEDEIIFINKLDQLLKKMYLSNHDSAVYADIVERFFTDLPGAISNKIILSEFPDALKLGSSDQINLAKTLLEPNGRLQGYVRASLVRKHFNFILNSRKVYSERQGLTLLRQYEKRDNNEDLVQATVNDVAQFDRWIFDPEPEPDPILSILGPLIKGKQYLRGFRQLEPLPGKKNPIEKKITAIYFDISGSMRGDSAYTQAAAILAYIDMALSEKDSMGNPTHQVFLFPFGDQILNGILIETPEQAASTIMQLAVSSTQSELGTKLELPFEHFRQLVIKYQSNKKSTKVIDKLELSEANMILMTDGIDETFDFKKIQKEYDTLPKDINIFINLISIMSHNPELAKLAKMTNSSSQHSMYTFLTPKDIRKFMSDSKQLNVDEQAYHFDKTKPRQFSFSDFSKISFPKNKNNINEEELQMLISQLQITKQKNLTLSPKRLDAILNIKELINHGVSLSREYKRALLLGALRFYAKDPQTSLSNLSPMEFETLNQLIKWSQK